MEVVRVCLDDGLMAVFDPELAFEVNVLHRIKLCYI